MRFTPIPAAVLLLLAACGSADVTLDAAEATPGAALAPGEALALTPVPGTPTEILACVEEAVADELDDGALLASADFRAAMAPVLSGPTGTWADYKARLGDPAVTGHAQSLGLRYIVAVGGSESTADSSWGECGGGYAGVACIGGMGQRETVRLTARILDVGAGAAEAERITATGTGRNEVGMILIVPYVWVTRTETTVCSALARQIARFASGQPVEEIADTDG